jgi:hypothetical protein
MEISVEPVQQMLTVQVVFGHRRPVQFGPYERNGHGFVLLDSNCV